MVHPDFFSDIESILGVAAVLRSRSDLLSYTENTSGFFREIAGILLPKTTADVQSCVRVARRFKTPLYPISAGKNWGMGSRLPIRDGSVILDLKHLNRIRKIDGNMGYAVIEAGVTQTQLAQQLRSQNCSYFLDVTGSSGHSSIIGNAMERGISYNGLRAEQLMHLEIVDGRGELIRTGFQAQSEGTLSELYRYGVGPSLDQLFFESNFGIVTAATVHLLPKTEKQIQFSLSLRDASALPDVFDALRTLRERRFLFCTARAGNKDRLYPLIAPLLQRELEKMGAKRTRPELLEILNRHFKGTWFVGGAIAGTRAFTAVAQKEVRKTLGKFGTPRFMSGDKAQWIGHLTRLVRMKEIPALISALGSLQNLARGIPTEDTLPSVFWPVGLSPSKDPAAEIDRSAAGLLFSAPLAPLNGASVAMLIQVIESVCVKYALSPAITLNTATDRLIEAVISLHFNKQDSVVTKKAQMCLKDLNAELARQGFFQYRLTVEDMPEAINPNNPGWTLIRELKTLFDPDDIIASGRYCPPLTGLDSAKSPT